MNRFRFALLLSLLAATIFPAANPASAQTAAVYGGVTATRIDITNTSWIYGGTLGAYVDSNRFTYLKPGLDARGSLMVGNSNEALASGLGGPRIAFKPKKVPVEPYFEMLFGLGSITYGEGYPSTTSNKFEYEYVGGADVRISPRWDWRPIEFAVGHLTDLNGTYHPKSITTGFVFRFK